MRLILTIALALAPTFAYAYIGPGMGLGVLAVIFGGIFSVLLAVFAVIYYPIKTALKKRGKAAKK